MIRKIFANAPAAVGHYLGEVSTTLGSGWNRFWFTPTDVSLVSALRLTFGAIAFCYLVSHTGDLQRWFGPQGMLPSQTVVELMNPAIDDTVAYRWSYLNMAEDSATLWFLHLFSILASLAFALGCVTRLTSVLTCLAVLSYVHRAPMLTGMWEPILSMMLIYLCLAPGGSRWSIDAWWRSRQQHSELPTPQVSVSATVAVRLMQIHIAAFCIAMGLMKLAGDTWWVGEAMWWVIARPESRLVDLTFLASTFLVINLWTHTIVLFEISFGLLIWFKPLRPLMLLIGCLMWIGLGLATGEIAFFATMCLASMAFWNPEHLRELSSP